MLKLFIFIFLFYPTNGNNNKFCNLSCGNEINTACARKNCKVSPDCGPKAIAIPFNEKERKVIVELHNSLRNERAIGNPRFPKMTASNMYLLKYDNELAYVAQCWANACGFLKNQDHDVCRKTSKFPNPGQNYFSLPLKGSPTTIHDYSNFTAELIMEWYYSGIDMTTVSIIDSFSDKVNDDVIRHLTQFIWAKTTHVGCGRTRYTKDGVQYLSLVCNYGPGGNIVGKPVYKRGKPCSECKPNKCDDWYLGLCVANSFEPHADKLIPPGGTSKCSIGGHFYNVLPLLHLCLRYLH